MKYKHQAFSVCNRTDNSNPALAFAVSNIDINFQWFQYFLIKLLAFAFFHFQIPAAKLSLQIPYSTFHLLIKLVIVDGRFDFPPTDN